MDEDITTLEHLAKSIDNISLNQARQAESLMANDQSDIQALLIRVIIIYNNHNDIKNHSKEWKIRRPMLSAVFGKYFVKNIETERVFH